VNQVQSNLETDEQARVVVAQGPNVTYLGPRIEQCDFEDLLERAMKILSARAKAAPS